MRLQGGHVFHVPRQAIWECLFDPPRLASALPGCRRFEATGPNTYALELIISLAVLKGTYKGTITVEDAVAPHHLTLRADGSGPGGKVHGVGQFQLLPVASPSDGAAADEAAMSWCSLRYDGDVQFSGMLKLLGGQVVSPAARAVIDRFFQRLEAALFAQTGPTSAEQPDTDRTDISS